MIRPSESCDLCYMTYKSRKLYEIHLDGLSHRTLEFIHHELALLSCTDDTPEEPEPVRARNLEPAPEAIFSKSRRTVKSVDDDSYDYGHAILDEVLDAEMYKLERRQKLYSRRQSAARRFLASEASGEEVSSSIGEVNHEAVNTLVPSGGNVTECIAISEGEGEGEWPRVEEESVLIVCETTGLSEKKDTRKRHKGNHLHKKTTSHPTSSVKNSVAWKHRHRRSMSKFRSKLHPMASSRKSQLPRSSFNESSSSSQLPSVSNFVDSQLPLFSQVMKSSSRLPSVSNFVDSQLPLSSEVMESSSRLPSVSSFVESCLGRGTEAQQTDRRRRSGERLECLSEDDDNASVTPRRRSKSRSSRKYSKSRSGSPVRCSADGRSKERESKERRRKSSKSSGRTDRHRRHSSSHKPRPPVKRRVFEDGECSSSFEADNPDVVNDSSHENRLYDNTSKKQREKETPKKHRVRESGSNSPRSRTWKRKSKSSRSNSRESSKHKKSKHSPNRTPDKIFKEPVENALESSQLFFCKSPVMEAAEAEDRACQIASANVVVSSNVALRPSEGQPIKSIISFNSIHELDACTHDVKSAGPSCSVSVVEIIDVESSPFRIILSSEEEEDDERVIEIEEEDNRHEIIDRRHDILDRNEFHLRLDSKDNTFGNDHDLPSSRHKSNVDISNDRDLESLRPNSKDNFADDRDLRSSPERVSARRNTTQPKLFVVRNNAAAFVDDNNIGSLYVWTNEGGVFSRRAIPIGANSGVISVNNAINGVTSAANTDRSSVDSSEYGSGSVRSDIDYRREASPRGISPAGPTLLSRAINGSSQETTQSKASPLVWISRPNETNDAPHYNEHLIPTIDLSHYSGGSIHTNSTSHSNSASHCNELSNCTNGTSLYNEDILEGHAQPISSRISSRSDNAISGLRLSDISRSKFDIQKHSHVHPTLENFDTTSSRPTPPTNRPQQFTNRNESRIHFVQPRSEQTCFVDDPNVGRMNRTARMPEATYRSMPETNCRTMPETNCRTMPEANCRTMPEDNYHNGAKDTGTVRDEQINSRFRNSEEASQREREATRNRDVRSKEPSNKFLELMKQRASAPSDVLALIRKT